jgi:SAM-dependent methyltransferase
MRQWCRRGDRCGLLAPALLGLLLAGTQLACARERVVRYEPTPPDIVQAMLEMAGVHEADVVYDLGSGDGRIVIAAARDRGARGVGVEIDRSLVDRAERAAREAGVAERVEFRNQDLFEADLRPATVVMLYLLPQVNLQLRPRLLRDLQPGTRIVSHSHDMGNWTPRETARVRSRHTGREHVLHLWTVPPRVPDRDPRASTTDGDERLVSR